MVSQRDGEMTQVDPTDLETFVIIHDQDLLIQAERERRYANVGRYRYLFVGAGSVSRVGSRPDVIVARSLPDNLEHFPALLSFTGWYAIARNRLATTRRVALLEYDVRLHRDVERRVANALDARRAVVGFIPHRLTDPVFLHTTPWLIDSTRDVYGLDLVAMIRDHLECGRPDRWLATSNRAMDVDTLAAFVDWFMPLTEVFRHDLSGSHVHERAVSIFCMVSGIDEVLVPEAVEHEQRWSHRSGGRSPEEARERAIASDPVFPTALLYARLIDAEHDLEERTARVKALEQTVDEQFEVLQRLRRDLERERSRSASLERRYAMVSARLQMTLGSRAWRLIAPLRWAAGMGRAVLGRVATAARRSGVR